jgi:hypothetical protein
MDDHGIPAGIVDDHLEVVVANDPPVVGRATSSTEDPPAPAIRDPALLLVVLMDERAGMTSDVANRCSRHPVGVP